MQAHYDDMAGQSGGWCLPSASGLQCGNTGGGGGCENLYTSCDYFASSAGANQYCQGVPCCQWARDWMTERCPKSCGFCGSVGKPHSTVCSNGLSIKYVRKIFGFLDPPSAIRVDLQY